MRTERDFRKVKSCVAPKGNVVRDKIRKNKRPDNVVIFLRKLLLLNDMTNSHMRPILQLQKAITFRVLLFVLN